MDKSTPRMMTPDINWTTFLRMEDEVPGCPIRLELVKTPDGGLEPSGRPGTNLIPGKLLNN